MLSVIARHKRQQGHSLVVRANTVRESHEDVTRCDPMNIHTYAEQWSHESVVNNKEQVLMSG